MNVKEIINLHINYLLAIYRHMYKYNIQYVLLSETVFPIILYLSQLITFNMETCQFILSSGLTIDSILKIPIK